MHQAAKREFDVKINNNHGFELSGTWTLAELG